MVTDARYERYKDALRRGHVAALRGRLDVALEAYGEAAGIAPDRPLPHASIGGVLLRQGRAEEALEAYERALERSPEDEAALGGLAQVHAALGRRIHGAETLDRLAEAQEAAGRLPEACDTARRALELAESKRRRRRVERLADRLREVPADAQAVAALERALGVLDAVDPLTAVAGPEPSAAEEVVAEPVPEPVPEPPRGSQLAADAEERLDEGDVAGARDAFLAAAVAHRDADEPSAALDACYLALSIAPSDPELHLTLASLYLDRGWRGHAAEKLLLLGRLAAIEDDAGTRARICELATARLPDEPRLAAVCAAG